MRRLALVVTFMAAGAVLGAQVVIDFESPTYTAGMPLNGQDGWTMISGTIASNASVLAGDNGPSLAGQQCVDISNLQSDIRMEKPIADMVAAGGPLVSFQYDVKNLRNIVDPATPAPDWSVSTFRSRLYDSAGGVAAVGNMHYDGGAGPACQAWAYDTAGGANGWAPGGPAWWDRQWHTVSWEFDYSTKNFISVTFDGVVYPQDGWDFADWPPEASAADMLRFWLTAVGAEPDQADHYRYDNIIVTAVPEPAALLLLAVGGLLIRRR
jgi:hypothetical protein